MKTIMLLSLAAVSALNAGSIDEAFKGGKASGQIRAAYVDQDNAVDTDTYGTSLGGILKFETAASHGITLGVAGYASQKIHSLTGSFDEGKANGDLFAENSKSYGYVGEAYVDYSASDLTLRIGRQRIDTPLADTDDIRMHPNTFEAAVVSYSGIEGTTFVGGYVTRWAGYDSGGDISKFKKLAGDNSEGAAVVGIMNESIENLGVQGWYYGIDELADAFYTDATYTIPFSETMGLELIGQFATFSEERNSGLDGNVYGIGARFNIGMVSVGAAYNKASNNEGDFVSNGFGGGPYITSMEEMTIDGFEDVKAYQLSADLDLANAGLEGVSLCALYGDFKSAPANMRVKEFDVIATYEMSEAFNAEMSYAMVADKNNNTSEDGLYDGGYDRFLVRLNYNF